MLHRFPVTSFVALRSALATASVAIWEYIEICSREWVSLVAMCLSGVLSSRPLATHDVNSYCDCLQMRWPNAMPDSAKMVNLLSWGYLSMLQFIGKLVGTNLHGVTDEHELTVSFGEPRSRPHPAVAEMWSVFWNRAAFIYFLPKSEFWRTRMIAMNAAKFLRYIGVPWVKGNAAVFAFRYYGNIPARHGLAPRKLDCVGAGSVIAPSALFILPQWIGGGA